MKKTKIVSTLGPASSDLDTICKLIEAGANVFRFNFSHGDHEEHLGRINLVHQAEKITGKMVGIILILKVPKFVRLYKKKARSSLKSVMKYVFPWMIPSKARMKRLP